MNEEVLANHELDRLIALFNLGRHTELEALATALTQEYPYHGIAWKLLGAALFVAGRYEEAREPLKRAVELLPNDLEIHNISALTLYGLGRFAEAEICFRRVLQIEPNLADVYNNLGNAIRESGRKADAVDCYRMAIQIKPDFFDAYDNLGSTLMDSGFIAEAEACFRRAIEIRPSDPDAYNILGVMLKNLGRLAEAEVCYQNAVEIEPDFAEAYNNLGITLKELGRLDEAEAKYRQALRIKPDFSDVYNNLGIVLKDLGRLEEAENCYRRALEIKPGVVEVSTNLAALLNSWGKFDMALDVIWPTLQNKESIEAKHIFVDCLKRSNPSYVDNDIRVAITRALVEPWGRPSDIALVAANLVMHTPQICECINRANKVWPLRLSEQDLYGDNTFSTLVDDPLLYALLTSTPICTIFMERFLTIARYAMLDSISQIKPTDINCPTELAFYSALAQQCFINENVFSHTEEEIRKAEAMREALITVLETDNQVPTYLPIAVAAYFPLHSIPGANRLFEIKINWPDTVMAVLIQQISEPEEEIVLRASIAKLTDIDDSMSVLVKNQYEDNPYPRWIKAEPAGKPMSVSEYLRRRFPLASFERNVSCDTKNILIAGCGTGQHPIGTAQKFEGAQILAIDLSIKSLCYAKRKTRELGLNTIYYAQADLLKMADVGCNFGVIESCGVLHHLAEPFSGWRTLLSLLRPGGFMSLGFYSKLARQNIVKIRDFIAQQGYGTTANEIRMCRQKLADLFISDEFHKIFGTIDFFTISACRDFLFHVQEYTATLAQIDSFLRENNLIFLGFEIDNNTLNAYKLRFPDDQSATDLSQWQVFENENPDTFCSMYQFWIQKTHQAFPAYL